MPLFMETKGNKHKSSRGLGTDGEKYFKKNVNHIFWPYNRSETLVQTHKPCWREKLKSTESDAGSRQQKNVIFPSIPPIHPPFSLSLSFSLRILLYRTKTTMTHPGGSKL